MLLRCKAKAVARHANCPSDEDWAGWLFFLQHYRLPTRLLDWTESLLVATYFAVAEHDDEPGALWGLLPPTLNFEQIKAEYILIPNQQEIRPLFSSLFVDPRDFRNPVLAVVPQEVNLRMMSQFSMFTFHARNLPLEKLPNQEKFLIKFDIAADCKKILRKQLYRLGVRESNLFPDMENLTKEIADRVGRVELP